MMVAVAALRLPGGEILTLPRPARHSDLLRILRRRPGRPPAGVIQAFLDEKGDFLDRREAARVALEAGQIGALRWPPNLYSEDLW